MIPLSIATALHEPCIPLIIVQLGEIRTEEGEFIVSRGDFAKCISLVSPVFKKLQFS